ncbi:MAG: bifunctional UDP-N-acetylglucosamine diphosphorylase/glucosamine-1-phosphate N-acetyltransferase GlmU [Ruminococcaceae bacterium]|nr:bifunctional UDP-N-acetylglucosamine diphosphorylase/glucosamine-1-phosphate N-acetyltransferase GlmU [Oscillospiraceae bacterium]
MDHLNAIIVTTEEGREMCSKYTKFLHKICGRPMIEWGIRTAKEFGAEKVVVVTTSNEVQAFLKDRVEVALDMAQAMDLFSEGNLLVLNGAVPGITADCLSKAYGYHRNEQATVTDLKANDKTVAQFFALGEQREKAVSFFIEDDAIIEICNRVQLAAAEKAIYSRTISQLQLSGVTIFDPDTTYISPDVSIGMDTVVLPGCHISGDTVIGEDCTIGPDTNLVQMKIGNSVTIKYTVGMESSVGDGTTVGPFAYIRPNSIIGTNVKIGDFVEIKNSVIDTGTKVSHLTYVGDSDVGAGVNFGCGTVTVNYDGVHKHRTTIGDKAFIGCNTNLVAPVKVAPEAFIAAGSTITEDIPNDCLAIARARQTNIQGWVSNRKEKNSK